jgi:hypothetical protein
MLAVMKEFAIPAVKAAIFRLREIQAKAFGSEEHGFQINTVCRSRRQAPLSRTTRLCFRPFTAGNFAHGPIWSVLASASPLLGTNRTSLL